jgi:hypothetical protein
VTKVIRCGDDVLIGTPPKDCDLDAIRAELTRPDYVFRVDESRLPDPTNRYYTYELMAYHRSKVEGERQSTCTHYTFYL